MLPDIIDAPSPNFDERLSPPDMVVLHYTGMSSGEAALARLRDPAAQVSAHYLIEEDGRELEILRHSFPYGTTSECGLFFLAYTRDLAIPEKMLRRMMGASDDGLHDRLMEFTRAVSGATFFAPSLAALRSLGTR